MFKVNNKYQLGYIQQFPDYRNQSIDLHCKSIDGFLDEGNTQLTFTSSKSNIETLEKDVKCVQTQQ